jgi:hypothetical protein
MPKLPLKMGVLKAVIERGPVSEPDIVRALEPDYGKERYFSSRAVEMHILALRAVGLITETFPAGPDGEQFAAFVPTSAAKAKMAKYINS